ncbi:SpoIIE family protein phosphatase [Nonomuraea sp. FMUSA5-5]|uniref:SpoIIE family protein phosphatase n=1 Tax=Nonomuraea composti TaxID=2720023 RepID=A0ABX1BCW7_9ACTN|nr:SpoIIE family protein phosphatase [Nonomuraea sp. FMUSA5-5]NJP95633.1 SpoIIE family protein phosphatase [Nonomuraea sp. FMUSA5-5]
MGRARNGGRCGLAFEVLDPAPVGVAVTSGSDHRLLYTNAMYRAQFGERPMGLPLEKAFAEFVQKRYGKLFDQVYATGEPMVLDADPVRLGGEERFFTSSLSRVSLGPGEHGVLVVTTEVTEQINATREFRAIADERSRILRRYESLMRVSAEIIWVAGPEGEVIEPSPSWRRVTGQPWEEFRGHGWQRMLHPDDRAPTMEAWWRAVRGGADVWEQVYRLRTADGCYRHFRAQAVPIRENGRIVEWVGTCTDIEQQWRDRRRQQILDRANAATADLTSLPEMLGALADVIVPELADGCGVHLITDLTSIRQAGVPFVVERLATAARSGLRRLPPYSEEHLPADNALVRAVRQRRPLLKIFPKGVPPDNLAPAEFQAWLEANEANSLLTLPVVVDGAVPAVVSAVTCGDRAPIGWDDIEVLGEIFDHAHDALSNAIRFQRAQQVALALQHSLLAEPPRLPDLEITARYQASPSAAEVGGDWYDSFVLPDGVTVVAIGDVAGHDLGAAVVMSQLRNMLRALAMDRCEPPGEILTRLNLAMESLAEEVTATCVLARVEKADGGGHRLHYAVAGHPPPLLVSADGESSFLDGATSPLLGFRHEGMCASEVRPLPPGSTFLLYTDGLVERAGEHLDRGLERLRRLAGTLAAEPIDAFCDNLLSGLPTTGLDDIAVIALRLPPAP